MPDRRAGLGPIAQLVEQWIEDPRVGGSNPSRATLKPTSYATSGSTEVHFQIAESPARKARVIPASDSVNGLASAWIVPWCFQRGFIGPRWSHRRSVSTLSPTKSGTTSNEGSLRRRPRGSDIVIPRSISCQPATRRSRLVCDRSLRVLMPEWKVARPSRSDLLLDPVTDHFKMHHL